MQKGLPDKIEFMTLEKPYVEFLYEKIKKNKPIKLVDGTKGYIVRENKYNIAFLKAVEASRRIVNDTKIPNTIKRNSTFLNTFQMIVNGDIRDVIWTEIDLAQFKTKAISNKTGLTDDQEKCSIYAIEQSIKTRRGFSSKLEFLTKHRSEMKKIYPDLNEDWENTFYLQQKIIQEKVGSTQYSHYSRDDGFMKFIADVIKETPYNIKRKDAWNPADIWLVNDLEKQKRTIEAFVKKKIPISHLNRYFRSAFKKREIIGISLKKISKAEAVFDFVNLDKSQIFDDFRFDEYKLDKARLTFGLRKTKDKKGNFLFETRDANISLKSSLGNRKVTIQIKSNTSTTFSTLKFEGKDNIYTAALLGQAPVDKISALFKFYGVLSETGNAQRWRQINKYPKTLGEFKTKEKDFRKKFREVKGVIGFQGVGGVNEEQFSDNIKKVFEGKRPWDAHVKLMLLDVFHLIFYDTKGKSKTINEDIRINARAGILTGLAYLSEKKGLSEFGPFGKVY